MVQVVGVDGSLPSTPPPAGIEKMLPSPPSSSSSSCPAWMDEGEIVGIPRSHGTERAPFRAQPNQTRLSTKWGTCWFFWSYCKQTSEGGPACPRVYFIMVLKFEDTRLRRPRMRKLT